jgi:CRP-like cAMP-binding protein
MKQLFIRVQNLGPMPFGVEAHLSRILVRSPYKKGKLIVEAGQICRRLYFIESGLIRHFVMRSDQDRTTWLLKENDFCISVDSFFNQVQALDNIETMEDTIVWSISYEQLQELIRLYPQFSEHANKINMEYRLLNERIRLELSRLNNTERYIWLLNNYPEFAARVDNAILCTYLGMSKNTLAAIKKNIRHK